MSFHDCTYYKPSSKPIILYSPRWICDSPATCQVLTVDVALLGFHQLVQDFRGGIYDWWQMGFHWPFFDEIVSTDPTATVGDKIGTWVSRRGPPRRPCSFEKLFWDFFRPPTTNLHGKNIVMIVDMKVQSMRVWSWRVKDSTQGPVPIGWEHQIYRRS